MASALLDGVRILDFSRVLAGPFATAQLADLGAEVIKVERPGTGDDARHLGPFRAGESIYFSLLNHNKSSIALDLKDPDDCKTFRALLDDVDVIVENFRPGVAKRMGIDFESIHATHPRVILASISGYGQSGDSGRPAYDLNIQAASGLMSVTGFPDGGPTRVGESLGDLWAGLYASWAILAALLGRERGVVTGQHLDISMFDSMLALQVTGLSQLIDTGEAPRRVGNRHPISTPFDSFRAADGLVVIAVANDALFARLCQAIGRPQLADDPLFSTDERRTAHETALHDVIEEWTSSQSQQQVCATLDTFSVPASPVRDLAQAVMSPESVERETVTHFHQPRLGSLSVVRQPVRFSETGNVPIEPSPELGADTERLVAAARRTECARIRHEVRSTES